MQLTLTPKKTLVLSAAATHTPKQVQFYCVDLGGGGLMYLEDLPHVGGVATRSEPDRVNRVVAEMKAGRVGADQAAPVQPFKRG